MNPRRRLTALEKKIGPADQPRPYHILVIEPGQDKKQTIKDFKEEHGIESDDHLWIVNAVAAGRQKEDTDELQQAD